VFWIYGYPNALEVAGNGLFKVEPNPVG